MRLRARGFGENVFNKKHVGTGSFVNPYRESIEAVDFRVNEIRTVTPSDFQKGAFETPKLEKLHFFLLKSFHETNSLSSPSYDRCRELEDKAWDKYLPLCRKNKEATLAYHWKKTIDSGQHFSVLATFSEKKASWGIVFLYVLVIILLNCSSSFLYEKLAHKEDVNSGKEHQSVSEKLGAAGK